MPLFPFTKAVTEIELDPYLETADVDRSNNYYPSRSEASRFDLFQSRRRGGGENPMQRNRRAMKMEKSGSN